MRISIRNAKRAFLDFRNARFKKLTILVAILAVTTLGGYGALKKISPRRLSFIRVKISL